MDIRQLRCVIAVSEHLNFTRAAAELHITQPPLTNQIKSVERELGFNLFSRTKRTVQITPAGRAFVDRARRILQEFQELRDVSHRASVGEVGHISIGFIGAIAFDFFPRILRAYHSKMPVVEIKLLEANNRTLMESLRNKKIDIAFMRPYFHDADIETKILMEDKFVAALPVGHRLAERKSLSVKSLSHEKFVTVNRSPTPSIYSQVMFICEKAGFHPLVVQESTNLHTAVALVSAGIGIAILPSAIRNMNLEGVTYINLRDVKDRAQIAIAWRKDNQNPTLNNFLEIIEKN
jgi:DNA-binding transcriptional LysR family regulator